MQFCPQCSQDPNLTCGYHEVPVDYHDPHAGKARLAVAKYAATASQKAGDPLPSWGVLEQRNILHSERIGITRDHP